VRAGSFTVLIETVHSPGLSGGSHYHTRCYLRSP